MPGFWEHLVPQPLPFTTSFFGFLLKCIGIWLIKVHKRSPPPSITRWAFQYDTDGALTKHCCVYLQCSGDKISGYCGRSNAAWWCSRVMPCHQDQTASPIYNEYNSCPPIEMGFHCYTNLTFGSDFAISSQICIEKPSPTKSTKHIGNFCWQIFEHCFCLFWCFHGQI